MKMLREVRKAKGLTMKALGEMVGVSESAISQYEKGKRQADYEIQLKLSDVLDCSVDFLLRGYDENEKKPIPENEDGLDEMIKIFSELTPDNRSKLLELSRLYLSAQHNSGESK